MKKNISGNVRATHIIKDTDTDMIKNTPLGISVYFAKNEPVHFHKDKLELVYCLKGSVKITAAYDVTALNTGDIISLNRNMAHCISADENNVIVSFYLNLNHPHFKGKVDKGFTFKVDPAITEKTYKEHLDELINYLLSLLYFYIIAGDNADDAGSRLFTNISDKLLSMLTKYFGVYPYDLYGENLDWVKTRFDNILVYLNNHYNEKITLKSLSDMEHLNPTYLSIYFNKFFTDSFNNYLSVIRVFHSEKELLTTNHTIPEISYNCGFSSPKYYYSTFKKWYNHTPTAHRRRVMIYNSNSNDNINFQNEEIKNVIKEYIPYYFSKLQMKSHNIDVPDMSLFSPKHFDI